MGSDSHTYTRGPWRVEDVGTHNGYRTWKLDGGAHYMRPLGSYQHFVHLDAGEGKQSPIPQHCFRGVRIREMQPAI